MHEIFHHSLLPRKKKKVFVYSSFHLDIFQGNKSCYVFLVTAKSYASLCHQKIIVILTLIKMLLHLLVSLKYYYTS